MFGIDESPLRRVRLIQGKTVELEIFNASTTVKVTGEIKRIIKRALFLEISEEDVECIISLKGKDLSINHFSGRNCYSFSGILSDYSLGSPFIAIVDLIDTDEKPEQRRLHNRAQAKIPFVYTVPMCNVESDDKILRRHEARTVNIGIGGTLFKTKFKIDTGSLLNLFFQSPYTEEIISIKGRAVRRRTIETNFFEVAVSFSENNEKIFIDWQRFILRLEEDSGGKF